MRSCVGRAGPPLEDGMGGKRKNECKPSAALAAASPLPPGGGGEKEPRPPWNNPVTAQGARRTPRTEGARFFGPQAQCNANQPSAQHGGRPPPRQAAGRT